jgi:RNA polymerase sigma factor (sigma-70 family)
MPFSSAMRWTVTSDLSDDLTAARDGDEAAKERIFGFLRIRFLGLAAYRLPEAAEDVVHETLVVVHLHFSEFSSLDGLVAFTNQVLRNKIGNAYQERYRRKRTPLEENHSGGYRIDSEIETGELDQIVRESIERLRGRRPDCGTILTALYNGLEPGEICSHLGIPKSRLKVRTFRCREALRQLLSSEFGLRW